jgi:hypothetical protein
MQNFNKIASRLLGSARGSRAAKRVLAVANFFLTFVHPSAARENEGSFRREVETSTSGGACAPQNITAPRLRSATDD